MFDNYKIIKTENIRKNRKFVFSQSTCKYYLDVDCYVPNWLVKSKELNSEKIFILILNENDFHQVQTCMLGFSVLIKNFIFYIENGTILSNFDYLPSQKEDATVQFSELEKNKLAKLIKPGFDASILFPYHTDESWLDEPVVYGSVCTKCSRDYPWVPQDPEYVCHGCKIGY